MLEVSLPALPRLDLFEDGRPDTAETEVRLVAVESEVESLELVVGDVVSVAVVLVVRDERKLQLDRAQRLVEVVVEKVRVARAWGKETVLRK